MSHEDRATVTLLSGFSPERATGESRHTPHGILDYLREASIHKMLRTLQSPTPKESLS